MIIGNKDYRIEAFEREPGRWRARIKRLDGMTIKVLIPPTEFNEVTTSADTLSAQSSIDLAKQGVDSGGMV